MIPYDLILLNQTTKRNIVWATDGRTDEIRIEDIDLIKPRTEKRIEEQKNRTRKRAEVFTPTWVCNDMIDMLLQEVRLNVFPTDKTVVEITCGEAPFLVQRYDTTTGEEICVEKRKGILDRKLNQVAVDQPFSAELWLKGAKETLKTVYGYEFQGDNLFCARKNVFLGFWEHYYQLFRKEVSEKDLREVAEIISWNLFQMDGLKCVVPYSDVDVKIMDWKEDKIVLFKEIGK